MADDDHDRVVLQAFSALAADVRGFKDQIEGSIREYKATVNRAIGLLADEQFQSAKTTATRLDADLARRTARQRRTDRRDVAVLTAVGCLIIVNALAVGATIVAVLWLLSMRG